MRCFVTGGAGFIGSNLVESLVKDGHGVVVFDNLTTGNVKNLEGIIDKEDIIKSYTLISNAKTPDKIFHLGIPSSSPMYKKNPHLVNEAIEDWIVILEYAKKNNCKIVYASSSSIYNGNKTPYREDMPAYVTDYYTECRHSMERLAELYHRLHGVNSIGLRLFSVYGPKEKFKENYANCLTQFLWDMKNEKSPVIFGDGSQTRDLVYVSDVVRAFILAANSEIGSGILNIGTGISYSFNDIINLLNKALGTSIEPEYVVNPIKNYVQQTLADTKKAEETLKFKAKVSIEKGIQNILKVY